MKYKDTDICECSHPKDFHNTLVEACSHFAHYKYILLGERCKCIEFKLDNLKWLEQKAHDHNQRK